MKYKVGDKVKFKSEKQRYTIMACDERFIIAQKPFNARKTYIYTLVDLKGQLRSSDNYYCRYDYNKREGCLEALKELNKQAKEEFPDFWLSYRRHLDLDIEKIDFDKKSLNIFTDVNDIYGQWSSVTDETHEIYEYEK